MSGATELMRMSTLIWGRLDAATASGLSVSLPEACRLSDALLSQLRVKLGLDPSGMEITERIRQLRAQMERIRDQIDLEPAGAGQQQAALEQSRLARRLKDIAEKAGRGGDVAGLLGPLEIEAATFERDLIVNGARRRDAAALLRERAAEAGRPRGTRGRAAQHRRGVRTPRRPGAALRGAGHRSTWAGAEHSQRARELPASTGPGVSRHDHRADGVRQGAAAIMTSSTADSRRTAPRRSTKGVAEVADVVRPTSWPGGVLDERPSRMVLAEQLVAVYQTYLQTTPAPREAHQAASAEEA